MKNHNIKEFIEKSKNDIKSELSKFLFSKPDKEIKEQLIKNIEDYLQQNAISKNLISPDYKIERTKLPRKLKKKHKKEQIMDINIYYNPLIRKISGSIIIDKPRVKI